MFKSVQRHIDIDVIKISMIFALIYCLIFNSSVIVYKFNYHKASTAFAFMVLGKELIYIYLTLFIIFFGCSIHRVLFITVTILLFVSGSIASYYLYFFDIIANQDAISRFFSINFTEFYTLISIQLFVWMVFCLFVAIYTMWYFKINNTQLFCTKLISAVCLLLSINATLSPPYKILQTYFPIQYLHNTYLYLSINNPIDLINSSQTLYA